MSLERRGWCPVRPMPRRAQAAISGLPIKLLSPTGLGECDCRRSVCCFFPTGRSISPPSPSPELSSSSSTSSTSMSTTGSGWGNSFSSPSGFLPLLSSSSSSSSWSYDRLLFRSDLVPTVLFLSTLKGEGVGGESASAGRGRRRGKEGVVDRGMGGREVVGKEGVKGRWGAFHRWSWKNETFPVAPISVALFSTLGFRSMVERLRATASQRAKRAGASWSELQRAERAEAS